MRMEHEPLDPPIIKFPGLSASHDCLRAGVVRCVGGAGSGCQKNSLSLGGVITMMCRVTGEQGL